MFEKFSTIRHLNWRISLAGLIASFWIFNPGWLSADSVYQLDQAKSWQFSDWHPVGMSLWWAISGIIFGPIFLLLQQLGLYWLGWGFAANIFKRRFPNYYWAVSLFGFFPSYLVSFGHIWKDTQYASAIFAVTSFIISKVENNESCRPKYLLPMFALMFYAASVKPNGIPTIFCLAAAGIWLATGRPPIRPKSTLTLYLAATVVIGLGANYVALEVVKPEKQFSMQGIMIHDLQGVSSLTHKDFRPQYAREIISASEFANSYIPDNANWVLYSRPLGTLKTSEPNNFGSITATWWQMVREYPLQYIQHRLNVLTTQLRLNRLDAAFVANGWSDKNPYGFDNIRSPLASPLIATIAVMPWLYYPWLHLLAFFVPLIVLPIKRRISASYSVLSFCWLGFVLPHLVLLPASDFRYLLYAYLLTPLMLLMGLSSFRSNAR